MTYGELMQKLSKMSDAQLDCKVTLYDNTTRKAYRVKKDLIQAMDVDYSLLDAAHPLIFFDSK